MRRTDHLRRSVDAALSRRGFLGGVLATCGIAGVPSVLLRAAEERARSGAPGADDILVILQLSGGNDGLNTVIPIEDDIYHRSRPALAVRTAAAVRLDGAQAGGTSIALHPALEPLREVWDAGALAIVPGVGYPNPDRSHFKSMDIWHTAMREPDGVEQGWLGRALSKTRSRDEPLSALDIGGERLPLALSSDVPVPSIHNIDFLDFLASDRGRKARRMMRALSERERPAGAVEDVRRIAFESVRRLDSLVEVRSRKSAVEYPRTGLAERMRLVGQMVLGSFPSHIYYVSQGGYDTHASQKDHHAALLGDLAGALRAFWEHLRSGQAEKRVTVLVFSEFGRRVKENASLGTDHGAAAPAIVLGGRARGGVHGEHPRLDDLEDGDLRFHTDFRRIYATLLERVLRVRPQAILGETFEPLDLLES